MGTFFKRKEGNAAKVREHDEEQRLLAASRKDKGICHIGISVEIIFPYSLLTTSQKETGQER